MIVYNVDLLIVEWKNLKCEKLQISCVIVNVLIYLYIVFRVIYGNYFEFNFY